MKAEGTASAMALRQDHAYLFQYSREECETTEDKKENKRQEVRKNMWFHGRL